MANEIKSYQKKNGKFYKFQAYLGTNPITGKRVMVSRSGFKTRQLAQIALNKLKYEYQNSSRYNREKITLGELYELWFNVWSKTVTESTQNRVEGIFRIHVLPKFKDLEITKLDVRICQNFVDGLANEFTNAAGVRKTATYVGAVVKHGMRLGYVDKNPMDLVTYPRFNHKQSNNFWNKDQLREFLSILDKDYQNKPKQRTYFYLSAMSACRKGELLALDWRDVDFKSNCIHISKTVTRTLNNGVKIGKPKTNNAYRTVYLDEPTMAMLKDWQHQQREQLHMLGFDMIKLNQLVFASRTNSVENPMTPNHWLDRIIKKYNLKKITPHGLRHTVATLLSQSNIPVKQIQLMLGDSSTDVVLNTYTHADEQQKKETTKQYSSFLNL